MSKLPIDFRFSQSSLQDYVECPRRFELRYLQRLAWPAVEVEPIAEKENYIQQGAMFHRLLHQYFLGVPIHAKMLRTEELARWWGAFQAYPLDLPTQRYPEVTLSAALGDFQVLAKFDLLAMTAGKKALIVDWKTSPKLPRRDWLLNRMQTRLYRWVLARAGYGGQHFAPEQIEMVYWFAEHPATPLHLPYSAADYASDEAFLLDLMTEAAQRPDYPLTPDVRRCRFCRYRSLCQRGWAIGDLRELESQDDVLDVVELDALMELEF